MSNTLERLTTRKDDLNYVFLAVIEIYFLLFLSLKKQGFKKLEGDQQLRALSLDNNCLALSLALYYLVMLTGR